MKIKTIAASAAITIASALMIATPAAATDGPFKNCTEAYDAGYSNIPKGDSHYGEHLDRDKDGIGCDTPPSDFVPRDESGDGKGKVSDTDLAETGGNSATPYIAVGGAALLGGGVALALRRKRVN